MADKKELLQKSYSLKSEISQIKQELHSVTLRKKNLYVRLDEFGASFRPLIEKIKELRRKRNEHTASVKELKTKRQAASSEAKETMTDLDKLRHEKEKKSQDLGVKRPASVIASEIDRMEFKIETGVIPFAQEQRLNKLIKGKKAELEKAKQLTSVVSRLRASSDKFHASKSESDNAHQELQLHASVSQKLHEEMLSHAKKADELTARMKPLDREKNELAKQYSLLKSQLQQKLSELDALNTELDKIKAEEEKQKQLDEEKRIEEKERQLTEKMKSGKKLTRDDLIMLQGGG